jgi:hypothetical protein
LFFAAWVGQAIVQWQAFTDEQRAHGEPTEIGDFTSHFLQATLENWQSEFLQLFSFTIMAAVLIHKGSAESRDSDDAILAALKRIEDKLETSPTARREPLRQGRNLHVVPSDFQGWALTDEASAEPEGYYTTKEEAIQAGQRLAHEKDVKLFVHGGDGLIQTDLR